MCCVNVLYCDIISLLERPGSTAIFSALQLWFSGTCNTALQLHARLLLAYMEVEPTRPQFDQNLPGPPCRDPFEVEESEIENDVAKQLEQVLEVQIV